MLLEVPQNNHLILKYCKIHVRLRIYLQQFYTLLIIIKLTAMSRLDSKRFLHHEHINDENLVPNIKPTLKLSSHHLSKKSSNIPLSNSSFPLQQKPNHKLLLPSLQNNVTQQVQSVPCYFYDNLKHMLFIQKDRDRVQDYFQDQDDITKSMRQILIDWITQLHYNFKMFPNTLFMTVNIIDRYLQKVSIKREILQLVGTAALYIAAKYEQTYEVPQLMELVKLTACTFSEDEILMMEGNILKQLDFKVLQQTSYRFFEPLATLIDQMDPKNLCLSRYVLELSLYDSIVWRYSPSILACATIYLINKIRKRPFGWKEELINVTGYRQSDLKMVAKELCFILQKSKENKNNQNLRKKFSKEQFHEVTRIRIQRKNK